MFLAALAQAASTPPSDGAVVEEGARRRRAGHDGRLRLRRRRRSHRPGATRLRARGADFVVALPRRSAGTPRVIGEDVFEVDPWSVPERRLTLDLLAQTESVFALSNGHIGLRGNLDEGEPAGQPGTYLNGLHETRPLPYAEAGYGNPESGETMINVTERQGPAPARRRRAVRPALRHARAPRAHARPARRRPAPRGALAVAGRPGRDRAHDAPRLVRAARRRGDPLRGRAVRRRRRGSSCSPSSSPTSPCPRRDADRPARRGRAAPARCRPRRTAHNGLRAGLVHVTRGVAAARRRRAWTTSSTGPQDTVTGGESEADLARVTISTELEPGETLAIVKFLAYGWSSRRSLPALRDQVDAALAAARRTGWDGLCASQRAYLDDFWARADVELDGDPALQQAMRFALFSRPAVGGARRGPGDPGEGADRQRLRRPLVLGHGDLHAAGADVHRAGRRRATRCCGATRRSTSRATARAS